MGEGFKLKKINKKLIKNKKRNILPLENWKGVFSVSYYSEQQKSSSFSKKLHALIPLLFETSQITAFLAKKFMPPVMFLW